MEEKVLIKADFWKFTFLLVLLWIAFGCLVIFQLIDISIWINDSINWGFDFFMFLEYFFLHLSITLPSLFAIILFKHILKKREFIVTNKRVIVRSSFGFRKDIQLNKITSTSTYFFKGVGVASSSARIKVFFCKNKMDLFDLISKELLSENTL